MTERLGCDCGHVAEGDTVAQLVSAAQTHARDVHRMELPTRMLQRLTLGRDPAAAPAPVGDTVRSDGDVDGDDATNPETA